jgi:hypothetical protein
MIGLRHAAEYLRRELKTQIFVWDCPAPTELNEEP